ncbi:MAG TPA: amidohydrolase [Patescibacteria group bacterium]|nr:amidohydrolase [Patescibacteria group bacterium]
MREKIKALARERHAEIVALRRHFRAHPELSAKEYRTQEKVMEFLTGLGLQPVKACGTGVVAEIKGTKPGRLIALRADMDALPIPDECGQAYASKNSGVCHACGHDGHMAMLLGAAAVLTQLKDEMNGSIRLLFQPSEEQFPGGALGMIEAGGLEGVSEIIGAHLWPAYPAGKMAVARGRMMASASVFHITVQGKGGHSSMPHQAVSPILTGTQIVTAINSIVGCNVDPLEQVALAVCVFQGGEAVNIIPEKVEIKGTLRCFDEEIRQSVFQRIEKICRNLCEANDAGFTLEKLIGYPALINSPGPAARLLAAGAEMLGDEGVEVMTPVLACEDFAYYLEKIPGAFMFIGTANEKEATRYPLHHPRFDLDETALRYGVEVLANSAVHLLQNS